MNISPKIAPLLAAAILFCACEKTPPTPPITGTWEITAHTVVISAKDPEIVARIEEKYNALLQDSGQGWTFTFYANGKGTRTEGDVSGLYMTYSHTENRITLNMPAAYAYTLTRETGQMYWSYDFIGNLEESEVYTEDEKPVRLIDAATATITLKRQ